MAGERDQHVAADVTVLLHVVAGENGEGSETSGVAPLHGSVEVTENSAGWLLTSQVGGNIWVVGLKLVGVLVHVVTALGDSQGNNVSVGVSHLGDDSLSAVGSKEVVGDGTANTGGGTLSGTLDDGVEVVLGLQSIAHGSSEWLKVNTADGPVLYGKLLKKSVDVGCEMGSVEPTDTNVDNALLDTLTLVGGDSDILELGEVLAAELEGSCRCLALRCGGASGKLLLLSLGECPGRGVVNIVVLRCPADSLRALEPDGSRAGGPSGLENSAGAGGAQQVPGDLRRHGRIM